MIRTLRPNEDNFAPATPGELEIFRFSILDSATLIPEAWRDCRGAAYVFNPSLAVHRGKRLLCYRVVAPAHGRRIATCLLDESFAPVAGSASPLSDMIEFAVPDLEERNLTWHADPRLFVLSGGIFVIWNDGFAKPLNNQFLLEIDMDTQRPVGRARRITETRPQSAHEKNWMLFESSGEVYCLYSIEPHRILRVKKWGKEEVLFEEVHSQAWDDSSYKSRFGELRGGAPPVLVGDRFYNICHSSYRTSGKNCYAAAAYAFSSDPPFHPVALLDRPLPLPNVAVARPPLNDLAKDVVYPCGAFRDGETWLVSYGLNDDLCATVAFSHDELEARLKPIERIESRSLPLSNPAGSSAMQSARRTLAAHSNPIPLFYWDADGNLKGGPKSSGEKFQVGNFGDEAAREMVELVSGRPTYFASDKSRERRLLSIGSILHRVRNGDVVWGSGLKGSKAQLGEGVADIDVHAVRGPISYDFLRRRGIDVSKVSALFDPAVLIAEVRRDWIAELRGRLLPRKPFGIIPHFREEALYRERYCEFVDAIISPDGSLETVVPKILECDLILSSSLHGLVVSEALGIPAVWLRPLAGEDVLKYYDYYLGTDRHRIICLDTVQHALKATPMPLPTFDFGALLASFPKSFVAGLRPTLHVGERVNFGSGAASDPSCRVAMNGFYPPQTWGAWTQATGAAITTYAPDAVPGRTRARVALKPFNPERLPSPQSLAISINGDLALDHAFPPGDGELHSFDLPVRTLGVERILHIDIVAGVRTPMRALGLKGDDRELGAALVHLQLV